MEGLSCKILFMQFENVKTVLFRTLIVKENLSFIKRKILTDFKNILKKNFISYWRSDKIKNNRHRKLVIHIFHISGCYPTTFI